MSLYAEKNCIRAIANVLTGLAGYSKEIPRFKNLANDEQVW